MTIISRTRMNLMMISMYHKNENAYSYDTNNATKLLETKESDGKVVKLIKIRRREITKKSNMK